MPTTPSRVCAIVPCYKVRAHVLEVIAALLPYVEHVFVIDDACPEQSGDAVSEAFPGHTRITVHRLPRNQGVGGAVISGYRLAAEQGFDILVKVDGDGQMDPAFIPSLVAPILAGEADYTKGNRFFDPDGLSGMPWVRLIGNAGLSFLTKLSSGYWQIMDPTNGFTAIHAAVLPQLRLEKVAQRFFFETDMLFRLGLVNAVVEDIPMPARYGKEKSNLQPARALFSFTIKHLVCTVKRIVYQYFLRGFSLGSVYLLCGLPLLLFAFCFGLMTWHHSLTTGRPATAGAIMLAALPAIFGFQMLIGFFAQDVVDGPRRPLFTYLQRQRREQLERDASTRPDD